MTYKTKINFQEKILNVENIEPDFFQIIPLDKQLHILIMSELKLDFNKSISYKIDKNTNNIYFYNENDDMEKMTNISIRDICKQEEEKETGVSINVDLYEDEIKLIESLLLEKKEIFIHQFIIKSEEDALNETSLFALSEMKKIGALDFDLSKEKVIQDKVDETLKDVSYSILKSQNNISSFFFIKELSDLKSLIEKTNSPPSFVKEIYTKKI